MELLKRQNRPVFGLIGTVGFVFVLFACGGSTDNATTTSSSAPMESTTSTTVDPTFAAGERYIEIVAPLRCARDLYAMSGPNFDASAEERWSGEWNYSEDLYFAAFKAEVLANAGILSDTFVQVVSDLGSYDWPSEVQEPIDELIVQLLDEGAAYSAFSSLNSIKEVQDWEWPNLDGENHAGLIRAKLGLPSNVNDETNYCEKVFG